MFSELVSLVPGIENKKQEREVQKYGVEMPTIGLMFSVSPNKRNEDKC